MHLLLAVLAATNASSPRDTSRDGSEEPAVARAAANSFIDHDGMGAFWLGGQVNAIWQAHPAFAAPYTGTNSLRSGHEAALSGVITAFLAYSPFRTAELILDPEMALGGGLSQAIGAAGFPNLDVVRNPTLSHAPYIARAVWHQLIPLSDAWIANDGRGPLSSFRSVPRRRLEVRIGKMSTVDAFDVNPVGADSHLQFMNWAVDNNGAFDYAADTRGYTYGLIVEYLGPRVAVRLGEMLMPRVANGLDLDFDVTRSRGENLELQLEYNARARWRGTVRLLAYQNHANMGRYDEAIRAFLDLVDARPDVTLHRRTGRVKRGAGANLVQEVLTVGRVFVRVGWSDGANESFAYTEIENTVAGGADLAGACWRRASDKVGLAFASNGISPSHREYLRLGGLGFLLGDGTLSYARETIVEHYYNLHVWRGMFLAEDVQLITNPGYNAARGPVWVFSLRAHLEL